MEDKTLVIDFETFSEESIKRTGSYKYIEHPSSEIMLLSYKFNDEPSIVLDIHRNKKLPQRIIDYITKTDNPFIVHNQAFEWIAWRTIGVGKYGWPPITDNRWYDTMQMCGAHALPLSLDQSAEVLKLANLKNKSGKALLEFFASPTKSGKRNMPEDFPTKYQEFITYCHDDTEATYELYLTLLKFKDTERLINIPLTHELNSNGIPVDVESAKIIYQKILIERESFLSRLSELTNGQITTVNQTARMKTWLKSKHNVDMPNFQAETVERWLEKEDLHPEVSLLLEMRASGGKSSTAKYEKLIDMASKDNKIHSVWIHHGTTTGRLVGRGWQPTNLPKPSVKYTSMDDLIADLTTLSNEEINQKYGSFMKAASTAMRGHIKAPPGTKIFGADYAAIEARIVFWLANCKRGLQGYHDGLDLYKDLATSIYGVPYDSIDDVQRWLGKQGILGCGFGLAWRGFINTCAQWNVTISEDLAKKTIETYRTKYHEVPTLWESMESAAIQAVHTGKECFAANGRISFKTLKLRNGQVFLFMKLPSGRLLSYPMVSLQLVTLPWGARKKAIVYKKLVNNMFVRESTYGGKLTENAVQAIARDIMYAGMHNISKSGFEIILQVYDECISLAADGFVELEDYEKLMCDPMPEWATGLPLKAEGKIMTRYQKL